jgi:hypothetical protein
VVHVDPEGRDVTVACGLYPADADLIVAVRAELPGLLAEIERLRAREDQFEIERRRDDD